jgi:hypothetical protein
MMATGMSAPVPVIALLICAALGLVAFWFLARLVGRYHRAARPWAVAGSALLLMFVWNLPIYGGGENLASPVGKFDGAYAAYARQIRELRAR